MISEASGPRMAQIAQEDAELWPWISGVVHPISGAGGFLIALCEAAMRADWDNYPVLRPVLLAMKEKYPRYETHW